MFQIYQADLAKIGVTLTLKPTETVGYIDQLFNSKFPGVAGGNSLFGQLHLAFFWSNAYHSPQREPGQLQVRPIVAAGRRLC